MRLIMKFSIPVVKGNEAVSDGSLKVAFQKMVEQLQPEAAYFHLVDGCRGGTIVFEADEPSQMAVTCEPLFAALNAKIDIQPAISLDELLEKL
ncbi:hypothetical protein C9I98_17670 [Photobacterium sanctipauli]|uniref:DUF3303 domain-containing protein n=1 Tax=Photobacterium sanctipauli TaxID=1342794 RepID=A0A2T3NPL3_9GAMM|nr:hypothetical protein [Photobacterium sanctipauli]PSW18209.1 hypothetical protein C9I98_17670 [Photobacterium sanctipauli]